MTLSEFISKELFSKYKKLVLHIESLSQAAVAYSGGVDSALLLYISCKAHPESIGIIARSPSLAEREYQDALEFAKKYNLPVEPVNTSEIENPDYVRNDSKRCYYCKIELFNVIKTVISAKPEMRIFYGANEDDRGDYRPGMIAANEKNIHAPFMDLHWSKKDIRELARSLGLDIYDKPSMPCLASRIPYGTPVDRETLIRIEKAENILHDMGFHIVRVRHHGDIARIELPDRDIHRLLDISLRSKINAMLKEVGYKFVVIDLEEFRSGRLNLS